jgi:hypothetical protein
LIVLKRWVRRFSWKRLSRIPNRAYRMGVAAHDLKERALRTLDASRMHYVNESWPLRPEVCPCDVHFCEYLNERDIRASSIFSLQRQLALRWEIFEPWYGVRWWLKPWVARLRGLREPARLKLVVGRSRA